MFTKITTITIVVKVMIMMILLTIIINPNYQEQGEKKTMNID